MSKKTKKLQQEHKEALKIAAEALYFDDRSDFKNALHDIVKTLTGTKEHLSHHQIIKLFNQLDQCENT